jgi:hypothetical protein
MERLRGKAGSIDPLNMTSCVKTDHRNHDVRACISTHLAVAVAGAGGDPNPARGSSLVQGVLCHMHVMEATRVEPLLGTTLIPCAARRDSGLVAGWCSSPRALACQCLTASHSKTGAWGTQEYNMPKSHIMMTVFLVWKNLANLRITGMIL